jgi:hypothetical protein
MLPEFFLRMLNNHGDDLQQLALLAYLKSEDKGKPILEAVTAAKVSLASCICNGRIYTIRQILVILVSHQKQETRKQG